MFTWHISGENDELPGIYLFGQKQLRFNFSRRETERYERQSERSGPFIWEVGACKLSNSNVCFVNMRCSLAPSSDVLDWRVRTDLIARFLNLDNPDRSVAHHGRWTFSSDKDIWDSSLIRISEDFWKNENLSVDIEIGIKSMSENIQKPLLIEKVFFKIAGQVFESTKSIILKESPTLYDCCEEINEHNSAFVFVEETEDPDHQGPDAFRVFVDIMNGESSTIQLELMHKILRLAYIYKATRVTIQCEQFLMERTEDLMGTLRTTDECNLSRIASHHIDKITDLKVLSQLLKGSKNLKNWTVEKLIYQFMKIA